MSHLLRLSYGLMNRGWEGMQQLHYVRGKVYDYTLRKKYNKGYSKRYKGLSGTKFLHLSSTGPL